MFSDFEKNIGLKIKMLNEYDDPENPALHDPNLDLQVFDKVIKNTYEDLKTKHRKIVDKVKDEEYETFDKIKES